MKIPYRHLSRERNIIIIWSIFFNETLLAIDIIVATSNAAMREIFWYEPRPKSCHGYFGMLASWLL